MNELKEQYYREDFRCFKHYIITKDCFSVAQCKKVGIPVSLKILYDNKIYFYINEQKVIFDKNATDVYENVMIFDELPNIDLTRFYHEQKKPSYSYNLKFFTNPAFSLIDYAKRKIDRTKNFHFVKLNRNWEISNLSEEKTMKTLTGETIYYRLATISIHTKDYRFFPIKKAKDNE